MTSDHIILIGFGKVGFSILEILRKVEQPVVVIARELRPDWADLAQSDASRILRGDARLDRTLMEAGISRARAVIITTSDDLTNLEIALDVRRIAPSVRVILRLHDTELASRVRRDMGIDAVLDPAELSAPAFVAAALGSELLRAFDIGSAAVNILTLQITKRVEDQGETVRSLAASLDMIPLAMRSGKEDHTLAPSLNAALREGDEVVFAASGSALHALQHSEHASASLAHQHDHSHHDHHPGGSHKHTHRHHLWERPGVRPGGIVKAIWRQASPTLRALFIALILIVVLSVVVFHAEMQLSWVDSLYFTLTIITTIGFGDINLAGQSVGLKLFGCLLMISGAAMLVIFYSAITEYIVSRRLEEALAPRRTTLSGHTVVAGLGDLGRRVALRLHEMGEPVIAIERNADSEAARELAEIVPVLFGDASEKGTLERAGVDRARAVVAVTDDDMSNLRIAQRSEGVNVEARTVVRLFKSTLALKLGGSVLGVDQPLNPSEAAAATFAAAALAQDVLQGFTLGSRLLMLRWMDDAQVRGCVGKSVGELREGKDILVVLRQPLVSRGVTEARWDDVVTEGDRLVILEEYRVAERAPAACKFVRIPESTISLLGDAQSF